MKGLENILCDFYTCVEIPIQLLDNNLKVINSKGYSDNLHKLCKNLGVLNDISPNLISNINLKYINNIHFIIMPILNNPKKNGYFIVGPFKTENNFKEFDIPYKPHSCLEYITSMLENMLKDKLSKKSKFSTYVKDAIDFIHRNYYTDIKLDTVCEYLNLNKSYFCHVFKKETGYTFSDFLNRIRVEKSKEYLLENNDSILDVALSVGYNNHTYYSAIFKKYNGMTPKEYRRAI